MGIFGAIAEGVVAIRYDAKIDGAVKAVKELSGEQKKAAKQAIEAHKEERAAFKAKVEDFAKGAAIIGGAIAVGRSGLKAYREETRLMAGAAGVDIDRLSDSWDGLKTRMDLLTLAQAGHRGAWKLTTGQLEQVSEGMRALEAKGYDASQIFDKFTDVLKKGKLEGLDDFGLSLKATGNQTKDLQVLLAALGNEASDVGNDFTSATDDIDRATAMWTDAVNRVRSSVGQLANDIASVTGDAARWAAGQIFGSNDQADGGAGRGDIYGAKFAQLRGRSVSGARADASYDRLSGGFSMAAKDYLGFSNRQLFGASGAEAAAGKTLAAFQGNMRRAMAGSGPLATANAAEFARIVAGLPQDWRLVDEELGKRVDELQANLAWRMAKGIGPAAAKGGAAKGKGRTGGGRGRGGRASELGPGLFFGAVDRVTGAVDSLAALEAQRAAGAAQSQSILDASRNAGMQSDFAAARDALAKMQDEFAGVARAAELNKADEESFLAKTFGPLEEFDAYASAMKMLGDITQSVWGDVLDAIINGEELSAKRIGKAIGSVIGAKAKELGADGVIAILRGGLHTITGDPRGPAEMAAGAAMVAGSLALAGIAKELGGGSGGGGSGVAASAAGVPSGSPGGARPAPQSGVVIVGDPLSDDSPRERLRRVRRAMNAAGRPNEGVRYG